MRIWNADGSGTPVFWKSSTTWPTPSHGPTASASPPDGRTRRSASGTPTAEPGPRLRGTRGSHLVRGVEPRQPRIASASLDKTVRVWDAGSSSQPVVLRDTTLA
ncbi:MAG: hypothetical protein R3F14_26200 [Polyangiaceae bacterium]